MRTPLTQAEMGFLWEICTVFQEGQTYEEYCEAICRYLILCPWHYSSEAAKELIREYESNIRDAYSYKETVMSIAVDIGYCCG